MDRDCDHIFEADRSLKALVATAITVGLCLVGLFGVTSLALAVLALVV